MPGRSYKMGSRGDGQAGVSREQSREGHQKMLSWVKSVHGIIIVGPARKMGVRQGGVKESGFRRSTQQPAENLRGQDMDDKRVKRRSIERPGILIPRRKLDAPRRDHREERTKRRKERSRGRTKTSGRPEWRDGPSEENRQANPKGGTRLDKKFGQIGPEGNAED